MSGKKRFRQVETAILLALLWAGLFTIVILLVK